MSEVKDRLIRFLKTKKISQKKFAESVDVSSGFVNAIRVSISPKILSRIQSVYPELNIEWLMTGEGKMTKPYTTNTVDHFEQHGDHAVMAKKIQTLNLDNRKTLEVEETEYIELPTQPKSMKPSYEELEAENSKLKDQLLEAKNKIIELMEDRK